MQHSSQLERPHWVLTFIPFSIVIIFGRYNLYTQNSLDDKALGSGPCHVCRHRNGRSRVVKSWLDWFLRSGIIYRNVLPKIFPICTSKVTTPIANKTKFSVPEGDSRMHNLRKDHLPHNYQHVCSSNEMYSEGHFTRNLWSRTRGKELLYIDILTYIVLQMPA